MAYQQNYQQRPYYMTQQPGASSIMEYSKGGNRNAKNLPVGEDGRRAWSEGICSCFNDCGTCCLACWCPCIAYSHNKQRLEHLEREGTPHPDGGDCCTGDCWLHGCITVTCGLGWILQIGTRSAIRSRYRISGSGCTDCLASCFCNTCALTQEAQEIDQEEKSMMLR